MIERAAHAVARRINMPRLACALVALFVSFFLPSMARAGSVGGLQFLTLDFPAANQTQAMGINDSGQVVGTIADAGNYVHGYLWSAGSFTALDAPGNVTGTQAQDINNLGEIVGLYGDGSLLRGYIFANGTYTTFNYPGTAGSTAVWGLNDLGTYVGVYDVLHPTIDCQEAYVVRNGTPAPLNLPGADCSSAYGVNNAGDIVGCGFSATTYPYVYRAFRLSNGVFTDITVPGATSACPQGINESGDFVGTFDDSSGVTHGFVSFSGTVTTLDVPGAIWTQAVGINNAGQVVGSYEDRYGVHGFVTRSSLTLEALIRQLFSGRRDMLGMLHSLYALGAAPNSTARAGLFTAFCNEVDAKLGDPLTSSQAQQLKELAAAA
jgi:probable HAF family extracellular repeat protein